MGPLKFGFVASKVVEEGRVSEEDIEYLMKWSLDQPLPKITKEQFVLFLLSCQNNLEATKATIRAYYSLRNANPNLFSERDVDNKDLQKALETIDILTPFGKQTDDGLSIVFARLRDTYYGNFDIGPCVKVLFMTIDAMIHDNPPNGFITLFDMKGIGFMHLTRLYPSVLRPFFRFVQEGLPARLEAIHVLNSNSLVKALMKILSPFMDAELINKLHFHPPGLDMDTFYKNHVCKRLISEEYGGELPAVRKLHDITIEKLAGMKKHFKDEEMQRCDTIKYNDC